MKLVIGLVMMLAGIAFGLWAGVWWAFIGGIVDVVEQVRAPDLSALAVAFGIAKVFFAGFIGWLAAALLMVPGYALVQRS